MKCDRVVTANYHLLFTCAVHKTLTHHPTRFLAPAPRAELLLGGEVAILYCLLL